MERRRSPRSNVPAPLAFAPGSHKGRPAGSARQTAPAAWHEHQHDMVAHGEIIDALADLFDNARRLMAKHHRHWPGRLPFDHRKVGVTEARRGELLVKIAAAGLCHSDLSVIDGSRPRPMPMVLGHEAGIVEEVGEASMISPWATMSCWCSCQAAGAVCLAPGSHKAGRPVAQGRQRPQLGMNTSTTWSPTAKSSTPSPTSSTMPAASWPSTIGIGRGRLPSITERSE